MKKFVYFIVLMLIVAGGFYYFINQQSVKAPVLDTQQKNTNPQELVKNPSAEEPKPDAVKTDKPKSTSTQNNLVKTDATFSTGEEVNAPDVLVVQVDYDGKTYTPKTLDIKVGDVVIFKNNSAGSMWPASSPHPEHTDYPEFDPKKTLASGEKWQFTFTKAGVWKFHDHQNPSAWGTVNVINR